MFGVMSENDKYELILGSYSGRTEILVTLLLCIAVCHSPLKIKIMTILRVSTAPLGKKEPGGTRDVTTQISMACIFMAVTPPMLME
ncbi:hypothetical protein pdam_00023418 [Pocillopora damicornis]|uniref:Uncharacterized protein n=1 Tax=Pocillopora damicornis TaxID=46731 RepID=A0A3M6TQP3_POCDA|nr:hypothetical protein pdam_00023418 [Pocillopora damicornis]